MTETPARTLEASAVIIGAGIVGNSLVHHLAQLGWRDLVLVDKGPMPNPGGSTGHASNFIFPIEYSRMMFELTEDSTAQYKELGVFTQSGGIEVARTRMALTPTVHQMISVGPIALFADTPGEISYPIVRDVDTNMYERQHGGDMEVGSYAHRPIIVPPDEIPSIEESVLSPTEMPFTQEDFDPQLEQALELMPELLGDEKAGIRYAINGLISMTPDGHPLLGEMPEAKGLWSAAASWIKEGPGCGRAVAELMSGQAPTVDVREGHAARFCPHQQTGEHVRG